MFEDLFHAVEANVVCLCLAYLCQIIPLTILSAQAKGDDHQSVAANLIREEEKNKLSLTERAWIGGTM